jgi:hypothetical protein
MFLRKALVEVMSTSMMSSWRESLFLIRKPSIEYSTSPAKCLMMKESPPYLGFR